jgi:hypothetical protein
MRGLPIEGKENGKAISESVSCDYCPVHVTKDDDETCMIDHV